MTSRSRIAGIALATLGVTVAFFGPGSTPAHALNSDGCEWDEDKQDWVVPDPATGHYCARDIYTTGTQKGYVATRGAVLENGHPIWADYTPDQMTSYKTISFDEQGVPHEREVTAFVPGVPTRIAAAVGPYENAQVVGQEEVAFAVGTYLALKRELGDDRVELLRRQDFPPTPYLDKNGAPVAVRPLNPRTTTVLKLKQSATPAGKDAVLAEFPIDPSSSDLSAGSPLHTSYLVQTVAPAAGTILWYTHGDPKRNVNGVTEEGTIAYLSAFFSKIDDNTKTAFGYCKDYTPLNTLTQDPAAYATGKINNILTRDDVDAFGTCDAQKIGTIWAPMAGALVESASQRLNQHGILTDSRGRYDLSYSYLLGYTYWDTMYVTLNYQPLDIRSTLGSRWYLRRVVPAGATMEFDVGKFSAFQSLIAGSRNSFATSAGMLNAGNVSTDTHKARTVNFPVEVAYMNGYIRYANEERPGVPLIAPPTISVNENDSAADPGGPLEPTAPNYSFAYPPDQPRPTRSQVLVDAITGQVAAGGASGSTFVRRVQAVAGAAPAIPGVAPTQDGTPNPVYDEGLLQDLGRSDFANTDILVFAPSGELVSSRIGLRASESPGLTCDPKDLNPRGTPKCTVTDSEPAAFTPIADFIRNRYPGSRYKVVVVNRSTGYMGTGWVSVTGSQGLTAYRIEGDPSSADPSHPIVMRPPNLRVEITRAPGAKHLGNDLCGSLASDGNCKQIIGFEGGGLTDDLVVIKTEWLDWDGSPLPSGLPGFTARLSRVNQLGTLSPLAPSDSQDPRHAGDITHFEIRPNYYTQVVRLPDANAYHYYLHVNAANSARCGRASVSTTRANDTWEWFTASSPACASFAQGLTEQFANDSNRRPSRFVPIKVQVYDANGTAAALDLQIKNAREAAINGGAPVAQLNASPIYTDVYRAEAQFSIYDLPEFQSPQVVTKFDASTGKNKTNLSFGYGLSTSEGTEALPTYGSDKDLTWSLGFDELVALVNQGNQVASWDDLESLSHLSPADQLARLQGLTSQLSPSNLLALQLYQANDRGNPLYRDIDVPYLLQMSAAPITLTRRENLGAFAGEATLPPALEGYRPIPFQLLRDAEVKVTAMDAAGDSLTLVRPTPVSAGLRYYVLDGSELSTLAIDNDFTLRFEASLPKVDGKPPSAFPSHVVDIHVSRQVVRSNRAFGEIVEHDVNILDGSLRLSRQDFSLPGIGPTLSFERGYGNLLGDEAALRSSDTQSDLGPGWHHSLALQLSPIALGQVGTSAVPEWVSSNRGIRTPADVEAHLNEEMEGIGAVSVNGATFIKVSGAWVGERGRQAQLVENAGCGPSAPTDCFEYIARDGSRHFFDYPHATAAIPGSSTPPSVTIVDPTGLAQSSGPLGVAGAVPSLGSPGSPLPAVSVNRIEDRFGNKLQFHYRTDGRLASVEDAVHRLCSFNYDPSPLQGCETEQSLEFKRLRSVTCLDGQSDRFGEDASLQVNYCYDGKGNLAQVSRRGGKEHERYEYKDKAGLAGAGSNLWKVSNARGATRTFNYVPGRGKVPSGIDPVLFLHKEDMVESIELPPTEGVNGPLNPVIHFRYGPQSCDGDNCTPDDTRTVTDPRGLSLKKLYKLNQRGNPIRIDEPKGKYTELDWSEDRPNAGCGTGAPPFGHVLMQRRVFRGDKVITTRFGYDAQGNITAECGPGGYTQTWYHPSAEPNSGFGLIESHTDFRGIRQEWHYGANGFLREHVVDAGRDNLTTQYTPDPAHPGRVAQQTVKVPGGADQVTTFTYDQYGNLASSTLGGSAVQVQFDPRGRQQIAIDRRGNATRYHYDADDHVKLVELPAGVETNGVDHIATSLQYTYDAAGNLIDESDRNGYHYQYEYTAQNQVMKVRRAADGPDPAASRHTYYDELGNVVREEDWAHNAIQHTYDELGFRDTTTNRIGVTMRVSHDLLGNVTELTDFEQLTTDYHYDDLNRESTAKARCSEPDCVVRTTEYDLSPTVANLPGARYAMKVTEAGRSFYTGFDSRGLTVATRDPDPTNPPFVSTYDALGRLRRTVDEAKLATQFDYDARGYLTSTTILGTKGTGNIRTVVEPDANGNPHIVRRYRRSGDTTTELQVTTQFDAWNRPTSRTFSGDGVATLSEAFVYDGSGNVLEHTDTGGRGRLWKRDARGNLRRYENAEGEARVYDNFDLNGNAQRVRDAKQVETTLSYDAEERTKTVVEGSNRPGESRTMTIAQRDGLGNPLHVTDFRGNDHELTYTARHRLKTEQHPGKPATQYSYTATGSLDRVIDPRGFIRKFEHDALDRVSDVKFPTETTLESHTEYDAVGNVTLQRNRRGSVTETEYDDFLRPNQVTRSHSTGGIKTTMLTVDEYDDLGHVLSETDAEGVNVRYVYNNLSQLERTVYAPVTGEAELNRSERRTYYPSGALKTLTLPNDAGDTAFVTTYGYDKEDRVTSVESAGQATSYRYDPNGNLTTLIKPENQDGSQPTPSGGAFAAGKHPGKFRHFNYDALNRLQQVTDEVGLSTKYKYDAASNLTDVYGPYLAEAWTTAPHVHYDIDPLVDRATERTQDQASGNAIVTTFASYDENDNVTRLVDPLRRTFNYSYDHYDRLRSATYQDDPSTPFYRPQKVEIDINDATNVTTVTETKIDDDNNPVIDTTTEERDLIFDRLIHSTQRGIPVTYDYYRNGNRRSVSTPSGATSYTYDARGRLASTTVNGSPTSYQYYADGRIKVASLGNGTTTSYDYHPDHRIREISHDFASTTRKLHYDYDKNGNTTLATDKTFVGGTESGPPDATVFDEYDAADRLVQYRQDGNTTRYGYERYNRHTETVTGVKPAAKTFDYDPLSERLKKVTDTVANTTVTYASDDNGNIKTRETQPANTSDTFTYDVLNQLKRVTRGPPSAQNPTVLGRYDYDSAGRRVRQADTERGNVASTYDGISVLEEAIAGTPGVAHNHYDGSSLLASSRGGQDTYFHQDNLGSTTNQSDATASPSSDYRYDPFGGVRQQPQASASSSNISFTGQQRDEKTGLYYYGARFYDPAVGRFLTEDTWPGGAAQPQSQNKFLYAYSNPARFTDPTGHSPCESYYGERRSYLPCFSANAPPPIATASPKSKGRHAATPDNLPEGYTVTNADLTRWYGNPPSKEQGRTQSTAEEQSAARATVTPPRRIDMPATPSAGPGFWSTAWAGVSSGDVGPSSAFGQMLARGDFGFEVLGHNFEVSKTLQDDASLKQMQNTVVAATVGVEVMLLSGGSGAAGLLFESGTATATYGTAALEMVGYGVGYRAQLTGLEGGDAEAMASAAFDVHEMVGDAASGMVGAGIGQAVPIVAGAVGRAGKAAWRGATRGVQAAAPFFKGMLADQSGALFSRNTWHNFGGHGVQLADGSYAPSAELIAEILERGTRSSKRVAKALRSGQLELFYGNLSSDLNGWYFRNTNTITLNRNRTWSGPRGLIRAASTAMHEGQHYLDDLGRAGMSESYMEARAFIRQQQFADAIGEPWAGKLGNSAAEWRANWTKIKKLYGFE